MHCLRPWSDRDPRPHPEEKGRGRLERRARVSKDEEEPAYSPPCLETHRSAASGVDTVAFASRCDAPQHEGEERGRGLANEAIAHPREDALLKSNLRVWVEAVHCFRIVIYNENTNLRV
jgi:hypothetical protein